MLYIINGTSPVALHKFCCMYLNLLSALQISVCVVPPRVLSHLFPLLLPCQLFLIVSPASRAAARASPFSPALGASFHSHHTPHWGQRNLPKGRSDHLAPSPKVGRNLQSLKSEVHTPQPGQSDSHSLSPQPHGQVRNYCKQAPAPATIWWQLHQTGRIVPLSPQNWGTAHPSMSEAVRFAATPWCPFTGFFFLVLLFHSTFPLLLPRFYSSCIVYFTQEIAELPLSSDAGAGHGTQCLCMLSTYFITELHSQSMR